MRLACRTVARQSRSDPAGDRPNCLKVIPIGTKERGNLRPFYIVAKHLSVSNGGDNLAGSQGRR
jgi:hypothetical protein